MKSTTWWIIASVSFLVGMIMSLFGVVGALLNLAFVIAGWVLWGIGLVSYIRSR